jgi:hypothetical protein
MLSPLERSQRRSILVFAALWTFAIGFAALGAWLIASSP